MRALSSSISAFRDLAHSLFHGGRAEGQLAATERERVAEWSAAEGQNALLLVSPYPQVFQFRPSSIEQRVPFISLISFRAVKSGLDSPPPFFPFLIPGAFSVRQSLPLSVSPSPHSAAMPPRCDAPRHFELEIGVRRPAEEYLSLVDRHFDLQISYSPWLCITELTFQRTFLKR